MLCHPFRRKQAAVPVVLHRGVTSTVVIFSLFSKACRRNSRPIGKLTPRVNSKQVKNEIKPTNNDNPLPGRKSTTTQLGFGFSLLMISQEKFESLNYCRYTYLLLITSRLTFSFSFFLDNLAFGVRRYEELKLL